MRPPAACRSSERGITLVEAMVSLAIVAAAVIPSLAVLGSATDNVIVARDRRKLHYLSQIVMADIERSQMHVHPDEEDAASFYEEGSTGNFEGFETPSRPGEYEGYEWVVEVLREVQITGGEEDLSADPSAVGGDGFLGRPVTNEFMGEELPGGEEQPEGQVKRVLVLAVRRVGEDEADDRTLRLMTFLPTPGEDEQTLGVPPEGAEGAPGGGPAAANATTTNVIRSGSGSGQDRGGK